VGFKLNERDNRTPANTYKFFDIGGGTGTAVNTPLSTKRTQFELAGDYRISSGQNLRLAYELDRLDRWCDSALASNAHGVGPGSGASAAAILAYYGQNGASCVEVPSNTDQRVSANYRLQASDDLTVTAGVGHSVRQASIDPGFYNPLQANNQGYELPGYRAYFDASRVENTAKFAFNWQATGRLNLTLGGKVAKDSYDSSPLGVQDGSAWSLNFDASYRYAEEASASAYATSQRRQRDLLNAVWNHSFATFAATPTQTWLNTLGDSDLTVGLGLRQGGLLGGKLAVKGDLTESFGRSAYATYDNYANAACTAPSNSGYACGALPDIYNKMLQLRLSGDYAINASNAVVVGAIYQRLSSNDYYYNAYQYGDTPTSLLPTNQQSPSYAVTTVYAVYRYSFF